MDEELKAHLVGIESRLLLEIHASETRMEEKLAERINDSETKLLSEFWKWGSQ
jgi:hypothetical protein